MRVLGDNLVWIIVFKYIKENFFKYKVLGSLLVEI